MKVTLVAKTEINPAYLEKLMKEDPNPEFIKNVQSPEGLCAYVARVSSPNQTNPDYAKLLKYCMRHGHFSVFEQVDATFEIETSRAIAQQILRHRSFTFQEFSQRYSKADMGFETYEARRQDHKNRQNSIPDMSDEDQQWFKEAQEKIQQCAANLYSEALDKGVAKEQARFLLPASTKTRIFMKGSLRSWVHYINVRADKSTQKEHRDIAVAIREALASEFPIIAEAMEW